MSFEIVNRDEKSKARIGKLKTKSGEIETPFFMPVATNATVKSLSVEDLEKMDAKAIISNALILSLRPGKETVKKFGGIGKFMKFPGVIFTDSGGFQMYSKRIYVESKENGVVFKNPFNGIKIFMTPEEDMKLQIDLGSDVAMCLDSMPLYEDSKESIEEAVRKTGEWAKICKKEHDSIQKDTEVERRQLLFGICQGGIFEDLREISAKQISKIDFDGFAIGGLALGEPKEEEYKMIDVAKSILPENKPVYLMGAGEPVELLEAISRGVDIFDSRFPNKNARNGSLFTSNGAIRVSNKKHEHDELPIDVNCQCFVCKKYTRAYLRHLLIQKEAVGLRLMSFHNSFFIQELLRETRKAIKEGRFEEFKEEFKRRYEKV